jgi:hypothetical protein
MRVWLIKAIAKLLKVDIGVYDWTKEPPLLPSLISGDDLPTR